jgi:hypothetical protein
MRRLAAPLLAAACALAIASCGDTLQVEPLPHQFLEGLVVAPFPVYWLGERFDGLAVSEVSHDPSDAYAVDYGNCIQGGQGYCVPPIRIVTSPNNGFVPGGQLRAQTREIRGVAAHLALAGRAILIPTGSVIVDIYADNAALARAVADGLAPINAAGAPGEALPSARPASGFETRPLPTQVPSPLHPLGISLGGQG